MRGLNRLGAHADVLKYVRLNRRQLLVRSAAIGLTIPTAGALLAACDPDDNDVVDDAPLVDDDDDPAVDPDDDDEVDDEPVDEPDEEDDDVEEVPDDEEARYGGTLYTTLVGDPRNST